MQVQSATHTLDAHGYPGLSLVIDGHPAWTDTKFSVLAAGIAILLDFPDAPAGRSWERETSAVWESAPGVRQQVPGGTTDPVIVCLARRYFDAGNAEDYQPGPVGVPSEAEARAELARPWGVAYGS